ncbi:unnamed protein product [Ilex paraguariensis]|uniref:AAA+ ATPase domain-containing protein n=1 Tax=Ilex paraguariensis TaxID=185542 RepID=A0ABC8TKV0_9AQUA
MEILVSFASSLLGDGSRILCGSIYSKIRNFSKFRSNLDALEKEMEKLKTRKDDVEQQIETGDKQGKLPTAQVVRWLSEVNKMEADMNSMRTAMEDSTNNASGCCSNCGVRCKLSKQVVDKLNEVAQLLKDADFPAGIVIANHLPVPVEHIPGPSIEGQSTASKNLAMIMDCLWNDEFGRIGVWGMGGVGKTTLVKNLNNKLKSPSSVQPFSIIIWTTVSKDFDLKRVQLQLAERLKLTNVEESPERMAIRLYERFEKEKRFLLILDDVWDAIDLDLLGVPRPEIHKGSKIILTSRTKEVCAQMTTDVDIKVDVLNEEEAWQLFCQNAGKVAMAEPIKSVAVVVAKECCGLPLAIITVGASMRGKAKVELWHDALTALRRSEPIKGIEKKVFTPLKWSYDSLQDEHIKTCFLCCCLYPEDFSIEVSELIRFWFAEGLLDEHQNYEELENRGMAIIESLMDSCLLDLGAQVDTVKMHDVVRDVAIWIACSMEDGSKSFIRSGIALKHWPENDLLKSSRRLSFVNNEMTKLPDWELQCSQATTLLLRGSRFLEKVPYSFLQGFQVLRVLDLSGSCIKSLPLSLLQLGELRALILSGCSDLKELPPLKGLGKLQILDCCGTRIKALPEGIENLTNLRQLDLSYTPHLKTIRAGALYRLSNLESLNMRRSGYWWGAKEKVEMGQAPFEELLHLERLIVLYIDLSIIPHSSSEDYITWIRRLRKFGVFVKDYGPGDNAIENSERAFIRPRHFVRRHLSLKNYNLSAVRQSWWLLINATSVDIYGCSYINLMLENLAMLSHTVGSFAGLKSLTIGKSKYGFQPGVGRGGSQFDLLPNLEHLYLYSLDFLESISDLGDFLGLRFSKLRLLEVIGCPRLKYLLPIGGSIQILEELKEIKLKSCEKLEEFFRYDASRQIMALDPVVPNLRMLELNKLPNLKTLCKENESWPSLEQLEILDCNLLRKLPLTIQRANNMKEIRGEQQWWSQLEWDDEYTKSSLQHYFTPIMVNPFVIALN